MGDYSSSRIRVKRACRNCTSVYTTLLLGREAMLCPDCCLKCEESYYKIEKYFKYDKDAKPFRLTDVEAIAKITESPSVFVWVLAKEGRLGNLSKPICIRCQAQLDEGDKDICIACAAKIAHTLTEALNNRAERLVVDVKNQLSEKRYGLGGHTN